MQGTLVSALRAQRPQVHGRWEDLLRVERANTPLANPDALVHLIDWTLDEIFRTLEHLPSRRRPLRPPAVAFCPCGRNPLLLYFAAGEQALQESLVLAQAAIAHLGPIERDVALTELNLVIHQIARREIEAFCGVCQHRADALRQVETDHPNNSAAGSVLIAGTRDHR
ncbi:MAG: hypothetical protein HY736_04715 [Verrucomicrobia bacterium]|nr:hypothetical protein [Verrucomicrobiota bacterium]